MESVQLDLFVRQIKLGDTNFDVDVTSVEKLWSRYYYPVIVLSEVSDTIRYVRTIIDNARINALL